MSNDTPDPSNAETVATGDRRDEVHFEPAPDHLVKAAHLVRPAEPLPPQEQSAAQERGDLTDTEVMDVRVAPDPSPNSASVWDARPVDDGETSGNPSGR